MTGRVRLLVVVVLAAAFISVPVARGEGARSASSPRARVAATAQQRAQRTLYTEAMRRCVSREYDFDGVPVIVCYHADAACWWRSRPYYNGKCWNTYWLRFENPTPHEPWEFCIRAAWWDSVGRITRRGQWECEHKSSGPPHYAARRARS